MTTTAKTINVTCSKCSGRGRIEKFAHYGDGVCFQCNGTGIEEIEDNCTQMAKSGQKMTEKDAWISGMVGILLSAMGNSGNPSHWASVAPSKLAPRFRGRWFHSLTVDPSVDAYRVAAWVAKYSKKAGVECEASVIEDDCESYVTLFAV